MRRLRGAERVGRRAVELDPANVWGTHAVAHILEMQGRQKEGIEWLAALEPNWQGVNNLAHHLWWHRAMFHLERREFDAVLELYDRRFRDLASPLVQEMPDFYIDIQNAASMLFRLELRGVAVGERWEEIADKAEARIGDCLSAFTLPHRMMALAAAGRERGGGADARRCDGGNAHRRTGAARCGAARSARRCSRTAAATTRSALAVMRPALGRMSQLGGSHAQQDVLEQLFLDAAVKAGRDEDVRSILVHANRAYVLPPDKRVGYADAAQKLRP